MGKLTAFTVESAKPKEIAYPLSDGQGLRLRVATDGTKTWLVRYMVNGGERQYTLSRPYGKTGGSGFASLKDAREESAMIRALGRKGIDYQVQLEEASKAEVARIERERIASKTIEDLFTEWVQDTGRKDGGAELRRSFSHNIIPFIGSTPVKEATEEDMLPVLAAVVDRGSNRMAVMLLADLKQMFRWAERKKAWRKLIEDNPVIGIEASKITDDDYDGTERTRALSADEVRELWVQLPLAGLLRRTELACWIMLSCCCRIGELTKAKWEDVDLVAAVWAIPKENAKNKNRHTVFLSDFALAQFKQLREISTGEWCFPDSTGTTHVCVKSTTKQIRDRQMSAMNRKPMSHRSSKADALILSGGDWKPHDLRRTGSTMMQPLGVAEGVVERVLNHVEPNKLKRTYQTHDYAEEMREAWRLLGDRLEILTSPDTGNVIPIGEKAA
jgi:integrase